MDEKKHCKWYQEEFCTNDKSPCVADYCPVVGYPELCKFKEVETSEEKKLTDEEIVKALENTKTTLQDLKEDDDDYEKLLLIKKITNCSLDLIHRLQSENETLKSELTKELAEHEEFTQKAKVEIERLKSDLSTCSNIERQEKETNAELRAEIERLAKEIKSIKEMTVEQVVESEKLKQSCAEAVNSFIRLETLYTIKRQELEIANKKLEELKGGKID